MLRAPLLSLALLALLAPPALASGGHPDDITDRGSRLAPGESLYAHEYLRSANGQHRLAMRRSGPLLVLAAGAHSDRSIWSNHPSGGEGAYLVMRDNGELALVTRNGTQVWQTPTAGRPGAYARMKDDGNLVVEQSGSATVELWSSRSRMQTLEATDVLYPGYFITSPSGQYRMLMQSDGNVVLKTTDDATFFDWQTNGNPGAYAIMQTDGNFVVYTAGGGYVKQTFSAGNPGAVLRLQDDANVVVYAGTQVVGVPFNSTNSRLSANEILSPGWSLVSPNRLYTLTMQEDGNLVLRPTGSSTALWDSKTNGNPGSTAVMQSDGNLVLTRPSQSAIGITNTAGYPGAFLDAQTDGRIVVYSGGIARWARP